MSQSLCSRASNASSKMLEEIANRSQAKIYKVEGTFNNEEMRVIWNSLGLYISRNLRMGRGVHIPKLGLFTFTPPEVRLTGVTNEKQRDLRPRTPVFLIQKDFIKGKILKTSIYFQQEFGKGLRPYTSLGSTGDIPVTKMNLAEISSYACMSKDATQLGLNRIIKYISELLQASKMVSLQIPSVGKLLSRNNLVGVCFNQHLTRDTRNVLSRSVDQRKQRGEMSLTVDNLKKLSNMSQMTQKMVGKSNDFLMIDDNARKYLRDTMGLHLDDSNMKRSTTNFDRSVASKMFNRSNQSLKVSHMTQSNFFGSSKSFSRQFNMALRILKQWVYHSNLHSADAFKQFCKLANRRNQVMTEQDIWNACKHISIDITQQQAHQLFRILDINKDGFVTQEDWNQCITLKNNPGLKDFIKKLARKKYGLRKILTIMGLQGVRKVGLLALKEGLLKLDIGITHEEAMKLSDELADEQREVQIEKIIDKLNLNQANGNSISLDQDWQDFFFARLKHKIDEQHITISELESKLTFYDSDNSGFIDQSSLKTLFAQLGIGLTLSQIVKIAKCFPRNHDNKIDYSYIIQQVNNVQINNKKSLTSQQFFKIIIPLIQNGLPCQLPISVRELVSVLQTNSFKQHSQAELLPFIKRLDINCDGQISSEDIHSYKQSLNKTASKGSKNGHDLATRLREKSIHKKISLHDVFAKIDLTKKGLVTREQWKANIGSIIQFTDQEKDQLFNLMDIQQIGMVYYKDFIDVISGKGTPVTSEKFDWAEQAMNRLKNWYKTSQLTCQDAFRVADRDGDTYLSEKDLETFLKDKLKYEAREISLVRLQKLIKMLDTCKRGRLTYLDWSKALQNEGNWLQDAKQQIGIVLSRLYSDLSAAYMAITQGDKKMLLGTFQRWVKANHVLSGFMVNDDILKYVFAYLDAHKKGYLSEQDFSGLFSSYHWKAEQTNEFIDSLKLKFANCEEAFRCLAQYTNKSVNIIRFKAFLKQLFGDRFKDTDSESIWKTLAGKNTELTFKQFSDFFGKKWNNETNPIENEYPQDAWKYQDYSMIRGTQIRTTEHQYLQTDTMEKQSVKLLNNVKDILLTSPKTLEQAFLEVDPENTGKITNLMFKKAFRNLKIALTSKEIDLLLNYCHFKLESLIDWREFIKVVNLPEDKQLIIDRLAPRLQKLSDLLHYYMISPKDAFRKWNNPRTGYMSFEQFHKMLTKLYEVAGQQLPQYQQLKDLFEYIDIRKDYKLDFQQYIQVFRKCQPPSILMGTTTAAGKESARGRARSKESVSNFRSSPEYQNFVCLIGRNRKYLLEEIEKVSANGTSLIGFQTVEKILRGFAVQKGLAVDQQMIRHLITFSMTGQKVDYKLLFSRFKDLAESIAYFPKSNMF